MLDPCPLGQCAIGDAGNVQLSRFGVPLTAEALTGHTHAPGCSWQSFSPEDNVLEG